MSLLSNSTATKGVASCEYTSAISQESATGVGRYRWRICALLFFATTLNYMDRSALSLLKPVLQDPIRGIGMNEVQYAGIVSIFSLAYALGLLLAGPFIDKVGTGLVMRLRLASGRLLPWRTLLFRFHS